MPNQEKKESIKESTIYSEEKLWNLYVMLQDVNPDFCDSIDSFISLDKDFTSIYDYKRKERLDEGIMKISTLVFCEFVKNSEIVKNNKILFSACTADYTDIVADAITENEFTENTMQRMKKSNEEAYNTLIDYVKSTGRENQQHLYFAASFAYLILEKTAEKICRGNMNEELALFKTKSEINLLEWLSLDSKK